MDARDVKSLEITGNSRITYAGGIWLVPSQSANVRYRVNPSPSAPDCSCEDFQTRGQPCKHIRAVRLLLERQLRGEPHPDPATIPMRPKRPTYGQNWSSYNLAQTNEKDHFQVLLADLCRTIPQPEPKSTKGGRPALDLADGVFSAVFKVFCLTSARRFMCDLREAHERGHVKEVLSFNSVLRVLERPAVRWVLEGLIRRSSLPLAGIESKFAIDSSGFSTSRYTRWYDEKYGYNRQKADWVKAHLVVGTQTQIVTAISVDTKNSGDSPQFGPLLNATAEGFNVAEISADKAYLSNDNLAIAESIGAVPFIPFKSNSTPDSSELWRRMHVYFTLNRDDFLHRYHLRSNVESAFSMIKRKFADSLRAKTDTAMRNEALAKVLCHNLCCVISAWYELGIQPSEWMPKDKSDATCETVPLVRPSV
jgi:transposase